MKQILVVEPAISTPELEEFNHMAVTSPLPCTYHLPAMFGMRSLEVIPQDSIAGIVIGGSRANVEDGLSWQPAMNRWIMEQIQKNVPVFGICYGHQLIAHLFGSKVVRGPVKNSGIRAIHLREDSRLKLKAGLVPMVISHYEYVTECPTGFEILAESPQFSVEGLVHKSKPIWSFQPHPEATQGFCLNNKTDISHFDFAPAHHVLASFLKFCATNSSLKI